ncbi:MFS transporter [Priestia aryabhattai]|uniref:MFS transporter n=1 Tax=Priestia aryabhattai TaxID=412384 RepID=UPI0027E5241E|nr:MFS transporter [Priestia aryabhattai]MCG0050774.1 MFS transporter [Priestia aryabhattai]
MKKSLFLNKNFKILWTSQILQTLANTLLTISVMVNVYKQTNSVLGSGAVLALTSLAGFLSNLYAAKYINSFHTLALLRFVGWSRGVLTLILGGLIVTHFTFSFILLLIVLFVLNFIGAWYAPVRMSVIPLIVEKKEYIRANGSLSVVNQILLAGLWGGGGILILLISPFAMILLIMGSFFVSGFLIYKIKLPHKDTTLTVKKKAQPLWSSIYKSPILINITIMDFFEALANAIWSSALLLAFTHDVLGKGEDWWGFINASYFIGAILGGLIVVYLSRILEMKMGYIIALSGLSMGLFTFMFSTTSSGILALIFCLLMGPLYQIRDTCQVTVLQDIIKQSELAKVTAARNIILTPWTGVTYLIMGYLGDMLGVKLVFILAAALYCGSAILALSSKTLRDYNIKTVTEQESHSIKV